MDCGKDGKIENHDVNLQVPPKNCISDKERDYKRSLEDTNRNLTIITSKEHLILEPLDLKEPCENKEPTVCNGPKRLLNGLDGKQKVDNRQSSQTDNSNSKDSSSQCETCVKASEAQCDPALSSSRSEEPLDSEPKVVSDGETNVPECCTNGNHEDSVPGEEPVSEWKVSDCSQSPSEDEVRSEGVTGPSGDALLPETTTPIENGEEDDSLSYVSYESELQMPDIMRLIQKDLSEPYSIYTYRYFIHNWPQLCFLAMDGKTCVGAIVCKLDMHRIVVKRGYIAMLAVDEKYRKRKIGSNLVLKAIRAMVADGADEIVLETEITNKPALRLYENLGFVRDKRLFRYYLNGVDALRLKLWLR